MTANFDTSEPPIMDPDQDARSLISAVLIRALKDVLSMGFNSQSRRPHITENHAAALDAWLWLQDEGPLWAEAAGLPIENLTHAIRDRPRVVKRLIANYEINKNSRKTGGKKHDRD